MKRGEGSEEVCRGRAIHFLHEAWLDWAYWDFIRPVAIWAQVQSPSKAVRLGSFDVDGTKEKASVEARKVLAVLSRYSALRSSRVESEYRRI